MRPRRLPHERRVASRSVDDTERAVTDNEPAIAIEALESAVGPAPDEERPEPRVDTELSNPLGMYFHDMARVPVLRPREEFQLARDIEEREIALWQRLLGRPQLFAEVLPVCQAATCELEPVGRAPATAALASLGEAAQAWQGATRAQRERLRRLAERTAVTLRRLDRDKRMAERVVDDMRHIAADTEIWQGYLREVRAARARARRVKNRFIQANLRLVVAVARRFNYGRMPLPDLLQEGNIGLVKAVDRYDYRRGYRFSTYASWWIRHAISRALADKSRPVRLPVHMLDAYQRVARTRHTLWSRLGREPSVEELTAATGIAPEKIEKMSTFLVHQAASLDDPIGEEDDRKLGDVLEDPNVERHTASDRLIDRAMAEELHAQLEHLRPIEADILRQRFGMDGSDELTLKEIGEKYQLSRERIRQIQERALEKMRQALDRRDML
jgi:RNA polymerase primary sigma factor